jgi:DNA polymerase-3 subunit delta'
MAFRDMTRQADAVELLQRSLARGRLGHAYLFLGSDLATLELAAVTLAKVLVCENPVRRDGVAVDCCDACLPCRKTDGGIHSDVQTVRPESKTRIITVDQTRELIRTVNLTPTEAGWKVGIIVAADRMNTSAANAFLKTLEEPPARSILILLTTERDRLLETILSRCLRLMIPGGDEAQRRRHDEWLKSFTATAAGGGRGLLNRYALLDALVARLEGIKERITTDLSAQSPIERYPDAEPELVEKWEDELKAAIESEYRHQRAQLLGAVQSWLRGVWIGALGLGQAGVEPPAAAIAAKLTPVEAAGNLRVIEQLQRVLHTNVQEALALEVGMLRLRL